MLGPTHVALVAQAVALLGDAQEVKGLTPLERGLLVDLANGHVRGPLHEELCGADAGSIAGLERGAQAGRDAEDAEEQEQVDGAVVVSQAGRVVMLGDEAELEVVAGEAVDAVDEVWERRQVVPFVWRMVRGHRPVEDATSKLCHGVAARPFGSGARMAVISVLVGLASDGEDAWR